MEATATTLRELTAEETALVGGGEFGWDGFFGHVAGGAIAGGLAGSLVGGIGAGPGAVGGALARRHRVFGQLADRGLVLSEPRGGAAGGRHHAQRR